MIGQQDRPGIRHDRFQVTGPYRSLGHAGSTSQRLLSIGGHLRHLGAAAEDRIAAPLAMFLDEPRAPLRVDPRHRRYRTDENADLAAVRHAEHADAEPAAEVAISFVGLAATPL